MSQNKESHSKVLIIGSGPAGYTAAIYAARAMLNPTLISGMEPGGQLTTTTDVENYPGFSDVIQGPWLMEEMKKQAEAVGTIFENDMIKEVDFSNSPFKLIGESGTTYTADTVIISTGAQARWLNLESETKFRGFGVSACATCDGFFYKDKEVMVVGGGNAAVEEALFLTKFASKVTLVHRRDTLRAEKLLQQKILSHPKIDIIWDSAIKEVIGTDNPKGVTGVLLENTKDKTTKQLNTHGVFVAIGHDPATKIFKNQIKMDTEGYILTDPDSTKTNIKGIFAAGDVKDKTFRQAVTAAGMGCMAALEAEKLLSEKN